MIDGGSTVNGRSVIVPAFQLALPAWLARTVQVPTPVTVTLLAAIVQGPVTPKLTVKPELLVALTVNGAE